MTHLEQEIHQQPQTLQTLIAAEQTQVTQIAQAIRAFDPAFVLIAARGTSDNAARYAQYLFSIRAGLPVALATPSVHTLYDAQPNVRRGLVIGISQSGQSEDIRRVVADARAQGALTLSITNYPESPIAQAAAWHLWLHTSEEISVAASKTYTAQLMAVAMLGAALFGTAEDQQHLAQVPQWAAQTLHATQGIADWAQRFRYAESIALIGRGYNYCTAYEISLKIKELCYMTSQEYSEADFRHGPIALIKRGFPVMLVAPSGKPLPLLADLLDILHQRGAETLVISDAPALQPLAQRFLPLPSGIPEWLSPICSVIHGQVFALQVALAKGYTVDKPQGLQKVTSTQ
jgi:glutamine---fructose-6-phosphate transaminase (isomerizing)